MISECQTSCLLKCYTLQILRIKLTSNALLSDLALCYGLRQHLAPTLALEIALCNRKTLGNAMEAHIGALAAGGQVSELRAWAEPLLREFLQEVAFNQAIEQISKLETFSGYRLEEKNLPVLPYRDVPNPKAGKKRKTDGEGPPADSPKQQLPKDLLVGIAQARGWTLAEEIGPQNPGKATIVTHILKVSHSGGVHYSYGAGGNAGDAAHIAAANAVTALAPERQGDMQAIVFTNRKPRRN